MDVAGSEPRPCAGAGPAGARHGLAVFALGFLRQRRIARILTLCGWKLQHFHWTRRTGSVGVWGRRPVSRRGLAIAARTGLPVLNIEDAFLRSLHPGPTDPPLGLLIDGKALHFDASHPSHLEEMLATAPLDDPAHLARARDGIAFLRRHRLSKFNDWPEAAPPAPGYILLIDQTRGDAAIRLAGADESSFARMLAEARAAHPGKRLVIRSHPLTARGQKQGHFGPGDCDATCEILTDPVNPWDLLEAAAEVWCVSSQLGFEAILAGHRPVVFGQPFYAGWGLSDDRAPVERRVRSLVAEQLFAAAMLDYPVWYDPYRDRLCAFEDVARALAARARAFREDDRPTICTGMKPWKRRPLTRFLSTRNQRPRFVPDPAIALRAAQSTGSRLIIWATKETGDFRRQAEAAGVPTIRIEDGFLRSVGLGAELRPAASLVLDDLGIYFDPTRPSRLEALIAASSDLPQAALARAARLRAAIVAGEVSKYNVGTPPELPPRDGRRRILVPGQVEDDASIRLGCGAVRTNLDLLARTRDANPDAFVIYKPHPDVEAGLRDGGAGDFAALADMVAVDSSITALLPEIDALWTLTSLAGFEALLRGIEVHCLGRPFYAGWGLTEDHGQSFERRAAGPSLDGLVHAALIDYPRYFDPGTGLACPPEVIVDRLAARDRTISRNPSAVTRLLARLQGRFSHLAWMWRR